MTNDPNIFLPCPIIIANMEPMETDRPTEETMLITPTYAENVLHCAGFHFRPRKVGVRLKLKRISTADIDAILRDVDTNLLSSFIEDITFCDITKEDLRLHSQDTLVKLFQANQLIIEYLVDVRDTLFSSLNSLNEMHLSQKREIDILTQEVAKLKDELYWSSMVHASPSHVDPSRYPSQEPRSASVKKTSSFFEDNAFSLLLDKSTKRKTVTTPSSTKSVCVVSKDHENFVTMTPTNGAIRLHIVSSTNAILLQMDVEGSITIQKLKNKILSRLLIDCDVDFATHSLYYRDLELGDLTRNLDHYQVSNNAAIIFMPSPIRDAFIASESGVESKLDEITSIASKAYEDVKRALQLQLLTHESIKGEFLQEICKQIKVLEESLREEIQSRALKNAVTIYNDKHDDAHTDDKRDDAHAHAANSATTSSPVSNVHSLDLDEMVRGNAGCIKEDDVNFLQGNSVQISEILSNGSSARAGETRDRIDLPLTTDTTVEMTLNPPSRTKIHSPQERVTVDAVKEMPFTSILCRHSHSQDGSFSTGSLDGIDESVDLDAVNMHGLAAHTPANKGYLLYRGYNESKAPPEDSPNQSAASLTSSKTNHIRTQFRVVNDCITDTAPNITFGLPVALNVVDDLTSVDVSPDEIRSPSETNHIGTLKKGGFLKKFLKNKSKKNPKQKSTMVEI